ncbi:KpsF/GutQ family sugar-phosphate isomerase [Desulfurivibrio alkaliphilus]|uniref:KpsF/GutQ family protein n=1 Tax=Desulfurivibrio alkaliphilus (strain DSM 19089 / UNIQEM U267 / AHT2) TaxID=589865 RepID=D6Z453_DESAT|nr:KpsF/GutQ family sugar-phosphate isomerase [Desulfurivibrio alkaliphilus]ADH86328.1 KpsF/GutQ family protein [Desulfurivibrio alkaliphilus AHT 2]
MSVEQAREVLRIEAEGILALIDQVGDEFARAVELIMNCPSRLVLTGIGKSGIIGQKIAATLNSTGTPAFFLHPVEAMHGDLGVVDPRDVILAISYSGETAELNQLLPTLKKRGAAIIAMTGRPESSMARGADVVLSVTVPREACPLGLAPTASTTASLAMGDALAVVLLNRKKFDARAFRRNHPGGSLGERLKVRVAEVMLTGDGIPRVDSTASLAEALAELNRKNLGAVLVMASAHRMAGILTDGDVRRMLARGEGPETLTLAQVMTADPKSISAELLAADALSIMQRHEVTVLPVTDDERQLIGILHLQDLLGKGEFRFLV